MVNLVIVLNPDTVTVNVITHAIAAEVRCNDQVDFCGIVSCMIHYAIT